tara:strand:- start:708 stop:1034 length:327 start_codon:yes stop_codon:yes gene_type:complete
MAKIQISWTDNADNETAFKIYQSTSSTILTSDSLIGTVSLSGSTWSVSGTGTNIALESTNTGNSSTTGETFTVSYDESVAGDYYYGVSASNLVGDSEIVESTGSITVS